MRLAFPGKLFTLKPSSLTGYSLWSQKLTESFRILIVSRNTLPENVHPQHYMVRDVIGRAEDAYER
jgi:hypothetical protein